MSALLATVSRKREKREVALWLLVSRTTDDAAEPCSWGSGAATHLRALPMPLRALRGRGPGWCPPAQHSACGLWAAARQAGGGAGAGGYWWLVVTTRFQSAFKWEKLGKGEKEDDKGTKIVKNRSEFHQADPTYWKLGSWGGSLGA